MEISVAKALVELKTLDSRIQKEINNGVFIAGLKKSSKKVNNIYTRDEFEKLVKSTYESVLSLMERKKVIKSAVVQSNSVTMVTVDGKPMTVAEAIERKKSIELDKMLFNQMQSQYKSAKAFVDGNNEIVEQKLQTLLEQSVTSDKKETIDMKGFSDAFRETNSFEIINPLKVQDKIKELEDDITNFLADVDSVLTESNVLTKITIPDTIGK